ncbi:MAG: hypothetical protein D6731_20045 [Planctomycetota bacterium]|nr:MAG: hypothetical protein D6731_20045 [Planctomycetota bacterium]
MNLRLPLPALGLAAALAGCAGESVEPSEAYKALEPVEYPFAHVFESVTSAFQEEGFAIARSHRQGERADVVSRMGPVRRDLIAEVEETRRLRARIAPGTRGLRVSLAASVLRRRPYEEWRYAGRDDALLERVARRFRSALARPYRPGG